MFKCGYYVFLSFERRALDEPEHVAVTNNYQQRRGALGTVKRGGINPPEG